MRPTETVTWMMSILTLEHLLNNKARRPLIQKLLIHSD